MSITIKLLSRFHTHTSHHPCQYEEREIQLEETRKKFPLCIRWDMVAHLCIGAVLAAESFNSAIETLSDRVSSSYDEAVKRTKDIAAGAVLLSAIAAATAGLIIFVPKIINLF